MDALQANKIVKEFKANYNKNTPDRLKLCDVFCVYYGCLASIVTVYCLVFGSYPFNAFLSAVFACMGCFVLTVALRMQSNPNNAAQFKGMKIQTAFSHFALCCTLLIFVCVHFMG
eukprot:RCo011651